MTTLIIARHGNTFGPHDSVTYVGARTDLPLVDKGMEQARSIGQYLKKHHLIPDVVYSSKLQRTKETARLAVKETGIPNPVYELDIFNEIDYGPDENRTRQEIITRIGEQALNDWDERNILPPGWSPPPSDIIQRWHDFADQVCAHNDNETVLVVTSNGIARFAPHITGDYEAFAASQTPKMATGALSIFRHTSGQWALEEWNIKP